MCGIAGLVHADPRYPLDCDLLGRMTAALAHRGPNAQGLQTWPGAALGHRRLSIIDLATGDQPIFSEASCKMALSSDANRRRSPSCQ